MSAIGGLAAATAAVALVLLCGAGRWRVPPIAHPDGAALCDAGWRHGLARWELLRVGCTLAACATATVIGVAPILGLCAAAVPSAIARVRAEAARDRARPAFTRLMIATHAALLSGAALPEALRRALAGCDDPIARRTLESALARFDLGEPLEATLAQAARSSADRRVAAACDTLALGIAERLPLERAAALVGSVADRCAYDDRLDAEVRARASGARMQMRVLAALVPVLALYLAATTPGLAATLGSAIGRTVLVPAAALLELAGIVLGRRVVRAVSR